MKTLKAFQRAGGRAKGPTKVRGDSQYYRELGLKGVAARRARQLTRRLDAPQEPETSGTALEDLKVY